MAYEIDAGLQRKVLLQVTENIMGDS